MTCWTQVTIRSIHAIVQGYTTVRTLLYRSTRASWYLVVCDTYCIYCWAVSGAKRGSCCLHTVGLLASNLGHKLISSGDQAVAVAVVAPCFVDFLVGSPKSVTRLGKCLFQFQIFDHGQSSVGSLSSELRSVVASTRRRTQHYKTTVSYQVLYVPYGHVLPPPYDTCHTSSSNMNSQLWQGCNSRAFNIRAIYRVEAIQSTPAPIR